MVGGIADVVQMGAMGAQHLLECRIAGDGIGLRIIAAPDAGLVGDEKDVPARSLARFTACAAPGNRDEPGGVAHIAIVLVQRAVAVEEEGGALRTRWGRRTAVAHGIRRQPETAGHRRRCETGQYVSWRIRTERDAGTRFAVEAREACRRRAVGPATMAGGGVANNRAVGLDHAAGIDQEGSGDQAASGETAQPVERVDGDSAPVGQGRQGRDDRMGPSGVVGGTGTRRG